MILPLLVLESIHALSHHYLDDPGHWEAVKMGRNLLLRDYMEQSTPSPCPLTWAR